MIAALIDVFLSIIKFYQQAQPDRKLVEIHSTAQDVFKRLFKGKYMPFNDVKNNLAKKASVERWPKRLTEMGLDNVAILTFENGSVSFCNMARNHRLNLLAAQQLARKAIETAINWAKEEQIK